MGEVVLSRAKGPRGKDGEDIPGTSLMCLSPEEGKGLNLCKPEGRNKSDHRVEVSRERLFVRTS